MRSDVFIAAMLVTLPYMAPEQLRGGSVDQRADLWAAGVVLYELATGRRPFHGDTSAELSVAAGIATENLGPADGNHSEVSREGR
jgi:serine/threonine protein kinase